MKKLTLAASALLLATTPVFAGVVFEMEMTDLTDPAAETDKMLSTLEGADLKIGVTGPNGSPNEMIFRGESREMIAVDHESQSYVLIDDAAVQQIGQQLSAVELQMQEMLKDVPADQRAMVEQMMKSKMPAQPAADAGPQIEVRATGDSAEKNGFPCKHYQLFRDGRLSKDFWITDWDNVEGGADARRAFEGMAEFVKDMQAAMPAFAQSPESGNNAYEHLDELGGFPVVVIDYDENGAAVTESQLRSSKTMDLDAEVFQPPAGYKRQQMF